MFPGKRKVWVHGRQQWKACPPRVFFHGTDKVEKGLTVLFFGLVFSVSPLENFLPTPLYEYDLFA